MLTEGSTAYKVFAAHAQSRFNQCNSSTKESFVNLGVNNPYNDNYLRKIVRMHEMAKYYQQSGKEIIFRSQSGLFSYLSLVALFLLWILRG